MQRDAAAIRDEWLGRALSVRPADRPAAEAAISGLYRLAGFDSPRFHWVPSPLAAFETVPPGMRRRPDGTQVFDGPAARTLVASALRLRLDLDDRIRKHGARVAGLTGLGWHFQKQVQFSLARSVRGTLGTAAQEAHDWKRAATTWYDRLCVSWVAYYDVMRRVAGVPFTSEQAGHLDLWGTALTSSGWWWPYEDVCVVSERPAAVRTEPCGDDGEVRLHDPDGPAVRYADGWDVHAWHGTPVPSWVIADPDPERIDREANVEVRRCAIERIGWPAYIDGAGLRLVGAAPDPGNPGSELRLYDMRPDTRVLLAVNGSVERDGHRRRYGLTVPGALADPVAAAAWTYGLSAEQYSLLARRT
ncbi:DUF6745 domain-containing protein [Actinomadura violacea]|uniref:DUF6745 domain-containing protein n=1 Tax=Actinomadura violacea TaxID=2819934 RepID=A0ABS3S7A9_9ACTN|nr:hypothetical protein [Actinomadura violacea]MBO2464870.1 hypothetical protein [Actinomadura violacea]